MNWFGRKKTTPLESDDRRAWAYPYLLEDNPSDRAEMTRRTREYARLVKADLQKANDDLSQAQAEISKEAGIRPGIYGQQEFRGRAGVVTATVYPQTSWVYPSSVFLGDEQNFENQWNAKQEELVKEPERPKPDEWGFDVIPTRKIRSLPDSV